MPTHDHPYAGGHPHEDAHIWPPRMPSEGEFPAFLLLVIRDLQLPCICTGLRGHTNRDCPHYDLDKRVGLVAKHAADARRAAVRAERHAVDAVIDP